MTTRSTPLVPDNVVMTKFPFRSRLGFQITPSVIEDARAVQHLLDPISTAHRQRQTRLLQTLLADFEAATPPQDRNSRLLASSISILFAPSTAATYFRILCKLRPEYKDQYYSEVAKALDQEIARTRRHREPTQDARLVERIKTLPPVLHASVVLQVVSASRHSDVPAMRLKHIWRDVIADWLLLHFELPLWKSDTRGTHLAAKTIPWPAAWEPSLARMWKNRPAYREVYKALEGVCSPHDLRRWAIAKASEKHDGSSVLQLTCHADAIKNTAHIRRYAHPSPTSEQSQTQIQVSRTIWEALQASGMMIPRLF